MTTPQTPTTADAAPAQGPARRTAGVPTDPDLFRLKRQTRIALGTAALACVLTVLGSLEAQREIQEARADAQKQVAEMDSSSRQARALAAQAQESSHDLETRISGLESRIIEAQNQQTALDALYRDLSINEEDGALAEVEQIVSIANQELLLTGDVRLAIHAMENANRRLERVNRPSLLSLRHIIDQDLRRLRAVPLVDVSGLSVRIDTLASAADTLPLAAFARPVASAARASSAPDGAAPGFWANLSARLVGELGQAVRIQRIDGQSQAPLLPEQAFFLRQTLKLRLLTARQALLTRDETTFRSDLRLAGKWLDSYFDRQDKGVQKAIESLHQLADTNMSISLPDVEASLGAIHDIRAARGNRSR